MYFYFLGLKGLRREDHVSINRIARSHLKKEKWKIVAGTNFYSKTKQRWQDDRHCLNT